MEISSLLNLCRSMAANRAELKCASSTGCLFLNVEITLSVPVFRGGRSHQASRDSQYAPAAVRFHMAQ
jgi:hypothetical protein